MKSVGNKLSEKYFLQSCWNDAETSFRKVKPWIRGEKVECRLRTFFEDFSKNFELIRWNCVLRQALKLSYKKHRGKIWICIYDKFPKRLRRKLRQVCWNAAETITENNLVDFQAKMLNCCLHVLRMPQSFWRQIIWLPSKTSFGKVFE